MQNDLLFTIKSKFNILVRSSIDIIPAFCNSAAIGCIYMFFAMTNDAELINALINFGIILFISTIIILSILIYIDYKNYEITFYNIYTDRIEIIKSNSRQITGLIYFKNVLEINCHNLSLTQKITKLGNIDFITSNDNIPRSLPDIENAEIIYNKILQLIENIN